MNASTFFESLKGKLSSDPALFASTGLRKTSLSVAIEGGEWTIEFDDAGKAKLNSGGGAPHLVEMNAKTWDSLYAGTLNLPMAVLTRKIKVKGDTGVVAKFGQALRETLKS